MNNKDLYVSLDISKNNLDSSAAILGKKEEDGSVTILAVQETKKTIKTWEDIETLTLSLVNKAFNRGRIND